MLFSLRRRKKRKKSGHHGHLRLRKKKEQDPGKQKLPAGWKTVAGGLRKKAGGGEGVITKGGIADNTRRAEKKTMTVG